MTSEFDEDTATTEIAPGRYGVTISPRWSIGTRPNGGYLMAILASAMGSHSAKPDPLSVSSYFLQAPRHDAAAEVSIERARTGKVHETLAATLEQDGVACVRSLAVYGDLTALDGPVSVAAEPPDLVPLEEAVPASLDLPDGRKAPMRDQLDLRLDPRTVGWVVGRPSGRAEVGGWVRFRDGREPDTRSLLLMVDALPPTAFGLGLTGWVPTVELTTHVRARPAPGWLRVWVRTRLVQGGYLEEDAEVWDSAGALVAMSRQLALAPRASAASSAPVSGTAAP
jgi:acyl-CoA thioesterase